MKVLMSPPDYFCIDYEINPWMKKANPVDPELAKEQWQKLKEIYEKLGWQVCLIDGQPNLPDMVFTANAGLVLNNRVLLANFRHPDRQPETDFFKTWFKNQGYTQISQPKYNFEGEGDVLVWGQFLLAGYPWRSDYASHAELGEYFDREVISLQLTDARFYHLDTCLTPINDQTVAFYPAAFSQASIDVLEKRVKNLIAVKDKDALCYGLNSVCYRDNIVLSQEAIELADIYRQQGWRVWPTPISEFQKSGGGVKCLTLTI